MFDIACRNLYVAFSFKPFQIDSVQLYARFWSNSLKRMTSLILNDEIT